MEPIPETRLGVERILSRLPMCGDLPAVSGETIEVPCPEQCLGGVLLGGACPRCLGVGRVPFVLVRDPIGKPEELPQGDRKWFCLGYYSEGVIPTC